ncbi:MAG TPA: bifunctional response regulator/alkaline phosphatase family protein [Longimicrobiales bacterium]
MQTTPKRILWVDDEVELFEPHLLFLRQRGYHVDTTTNGDDALALIQRQSYDLVLLDEQMPGRRGLDLLGTLRREGPYARVVMVTKSEEDHTLTEAVGRQVDDYLVKPASPRQVLSVVTRLLEGMQLRQQQTARDFAARFPVLARLRDEAADWRAYFALYSELTEWHLRLHGAREHGLADTVDALLGDVRREFGAYVVRSYAGWTARAASAADRPPLSTDVVARFLVPRLDEGALLFMIIDCLRLDQWRALLPLLLPYFHLSEELYASILPTATPYARNALFSGLFPDDIARRRPSWWKRDEGSRNAFEDTLLREQLERLSGRAIPVRYEKVFSEADADERVGRIRNALQSGGVVAMVFNFVDLMTHGRSESAVLREVARDVPALRALTVQWFERSAALRVLREAAAQGVTVVVTSDHGSILCDRPVTVFARRDATSNLRYKFGQDLRAEEPSAVFAINDERVLRFPPGPLSTNYLLALEDRFFVYPTKLREYQARYRGSFLHGGVSPEEMILPVAVLTPRSARS